MKLYSKAAEVIRNQSQQRGKVDQFITMAAARGVKPSELANAGRPDGDNISKEELAKHFEDAIPKISAEKFGKFDPKWLTKSERNEWEQLHGMRTADMTSRQIARQGDLEEKATRRTKYSSYTLPQGTNYQEHLLKYERPISEAQRKKRQLQDEWDRAYRNQAPKEELDRISREFDSIPFEDEPPQFSSSHWNDRDVLAHLRMKDRDNGKTLHVEEVQSDWGQVGRKKGFFDPAKPIHVFNSKTGETVHETDDPLDAMRRAEELGPGFDYAYAEHDKVPKAPYVTNTQQWTDLALKHALHEAAAGNYDKLVFSPGEANADLYDLRKHLSKLQLVRSPDSRHFGTLNAWRPDGSKGLSQSVETEHDLRNLIGDATAQKLLEQPKVNAPEWYSPGTVAHTLEGQDLHVGGEGMQNYYSRNVHAGALKLAQMHDPSVKPESYDLPEGYKGFAIPMTDTLKQSILEKGFPAFQRGGEVGGQDEEAAAGNRQAGTEAQGFSGSGGVRGGQGLLPPSVSASGEKDLIGLPTSVKLPKLGQTITAGHDPRIRQVARDYARTAGIDYNPPTIYQKVDPERAKRIAAAYDAMLHDPRHPLVQASYNALVNETIGQYQAMKRAGVHLEFYPDPANDPYKSNPRLAIEDLRKNNHMYIFPTDTGYGSSGQLLDAHLNPMLRDSGEYWNGKPVLVNDLFRAVHDYFGHGKEGVGFRADGEENAWRQHAAMFSPLARIALGTETRGQNSWLNYGPHGEKNRTAATEDTVFADQKLGVLPPWVHHEGAEDFIRPHEKAELESHFRKHTGAVPAALDLTRRFSKGGVAATMALKLKGN